jgi:hypothetical protein
MQFTREKYRIEGLRCRDAYESMDKVLIRGSCDADDEGAPGSRCAREDIGREKVIWTSVVNFRDGVNARDRRADIDIDLGDI